MTDIYLYFRTQGTLANDDAISDSAMWPLSSFSGMEFISASGTNTARFYFKSMTNFDGQDTDTNKVVISDSVNVNLKSTALDKWIITLKRSGLNHSLLFFIYNLI